MDKQILDQFHKLLDSAVEEIRKRLKIKNGKGYYVVSNEQLIDILTFAVEQITRYEKT